MIRDPAETPFTLKRVQEMLGLSRTVVSGLIDEGFVSPARGPKNELRFSFQDLTLLRTAHDLQRARIAPRKILRSLAKLKSELPPELPLTGLRITAVGTDVVVRDRDSQWQADSGQFLMVFEIAPTTGGAVTVIHRKMAATPDSAARTYAMAVQLEQTDLSAAEMGYRQAIEIDPGHIDAYLNLGALLCDAQRCGEAVALYEAVVRDYPGHAVLHFNHAIALEDHQMAAQAIEAYLRALHVDPHLVDAHYNLARLFEQAGQRQAALRHLSMYRRLKSTAQP